MARYSIEDTTLTALGDAVRKHVGKTAVKPYATDIIRVLVSNSSDSFTYRYEPKNYHTGNVMKYHHVKVKITCECSVQDEFTYEYRDGYSYFPFTFDENGEAVLYTDSREGWVRIYIYGVNKASDSFYTTFEFTPYNEDGSIIGMEKVQTNTMTPLAMVDAVNSIAPAFEEGDLTFGGNCKYQFCYGAWLDFINKFGNSMQTKDVSEAQYMFYGYLAESIPFEINFSKTESNVGHDISNMFQGSYLQEIPKMNYCKPIKTVNMFTSSKIRYLPEDIDTWFDWSYMDNPNMTQGSITSSSGARNSMFQACNELRAVPINFLNHGNVRCSNYYSIYYSLFDSCYCLDEVVGLPFPHQHPQHGFTGDTFYNIAYKCYRMKNFIFAYQEDGSPYVCRWKGQTINLSENVGFAVTNAVALLMSKGMLEEKQIKDDTTYQALKDDPDCWTCDINYSRYNHDSAVATINSLPDTSAYLASAGGTNTIKFKGAAGAKTDGGAINTLTEEEIAVATAKGWTVTLV